MKLFWRRKSNGSFLKGVVAIAGGTAFAQAIGVVFMPLLTRLYSPEAMGQWGLFVSFLGVASVVVTLRYEVAIVAAPREEDALGLVRSSLVLGMFTGLSGVLAFEFLRQKNFLGYGMFPPWVSFLAFPALVISAWGLTLRYYSLRQNAFGLVGRSTQIQGVARPVAQILLAFTGGPGLLWGETLGRFLGLTALWQILPKASGPWFVPSLLLRYKTYPLVHLPSGFLDTLALMAPVPVFVTLYGPAVGGSLALAQRAVALPVSLIGAAVADVFYSQAAELARQKPHVLRSFLLLTALRLFLLALPFGLALWFFAPSLAPLIFGGAWEEAGRMMAAMAPWLVSQLTVSPVSRVVFLSKWSWVKLVYDLLSLASFGLVLLVADADPLRSLVFLSWIEASLYGVYMVILLWLCDKERLAMTWRV